MLKHPLAAGWKLFKIYFLKVCGEVLCNHFKFYTQVYCQAGIVYKFQINDVIGGHVMRP